MLLVGQRPAAQKSDGLSLITPARSSSALESLRRDVLGKQVASLRITDFLRVKIQHLLYTNIC